MPPNEGHRSWGGAAPPSNRDRRSAGLVDLALGTSPLSKIVRQFITDPFRAMGLDALTHNHTPLYTGTVVYSVPYCNWYRVQLDGVGATIGCTMGGQVGSTPIGPRASGILPPYSQVIVFMPPSRTEGIIIAAFPLPQSDGRLTAPDWVLQGSQAGVQRDDVYRQVFQSLYRLGGIKTFGSNRPLDGTSLDWGVVAETGMALHLDAFMAFLRTSEICGVWMHYFDDYLRLAGWNMDWQTAAHELSIREDEGEVRYVEGHNVYPWESRGLYGSGTAMHKVSDDKQVQFSSPKGKYDLDDGDEDLQPICRVQRFGGYLGQGGQRLVMVPGKTSGKRKYGDDPTQSPDIGVFQEFVGLDGTYGVRSARQLLFVKHCLIPVPRERRLPEDQKKGDDARKDNYKFSGKFGGGKDHKIGSVQIDGDDKHIQQAAGLFDLLAYAFNWQAYHPFAYHREDYTVPEEADVAKGSGPKRAQEVLNFGALAGQMYMDYPSPKKLKVDHRYGDVDYFERISYHAQLPDGSVVIGDGYGAEIVLTGGHIRLSAPGGIEITPGTDLTVLAGRDINLRAYGSLDGSAGKGDLRLKAEKNMQLLAHKGGLLLESQAEGFIAEFDGKVGTDVVSGGVMIKAKKSGIAGWSGQIYMRTGGADMENGPITLDAAKGQAPVTFKGAEIISFAASAVAHYIGPSLSNSNVQASYLFSTSAAIIDKLLIVGGPVLATGGGTFGDSLQCLGSVGAISGTPYVGKVNAGEIARAIGEANKAISDSDKDGKTFHDDLFVKNLYTANSVGDDQTIRQAAFSYRDDDDGAQYHVADFKLAESRWHAMVRLEAGTGGDNWDDEPTVNYQGREQLPYPGKKKWQDEPTLLQLESLNLFDTKKGEAVSRGSGGPYEDPSLGAMTPATPVSGFKIIKT